MRVEFARIPPTSNINASTNRGTVLDSFATSGKKDVVDWLTSHGSTYSSEKAIETLMVSRRQAAVEKIRYPDLHRHPACDGRDGLTAGRAYETGCNNRGRPEVHEVAVRFQGSSLPATSWAASAPCPIAARPAAARSTSVAPLIPVAGPAGMCARAVLCTTDLFGFAWRAAR
jgi:hypothetical protein